MNKSHFKRRIITEEKDKCLILIDTQEYQQRVLDCIISDEINKLFNATVFKDSDKTQECKQAMIHGIVMASMMTSSYKNIC